MRRSARSCGTTARRCMASGSLRPRRRAEAGDDCPPATAGNGHTYRESPAWNACSKQVGFYSAFMPLDRIEIRGARQHNLKNIDLTLPRDRLVVITGLSGSGKSSLAFDTIYAEGQRRYVESLSSYARQFLGQMDKPDVEYISGLSPAISIDQKGASHNPRSTVGTVTEIYDYLRLLFARIGHPHCPKCHRPIQQQTSEQIIDAVLDMPDDARIMVLAPLGACPTCTGLGTRLEVDPDLILANKDLSLAQGAIAAWGKAGWNGNSYYKSLLESVAKYYGFSMTTPIRELQPEHLEKILYGSGTERIVLTYQSKSGRSREYRAQYEGIITNIERRFKETESDFVREELQKYMAPRPCPTCKGARLKPEALAVTIAGRNIQEVVDYSVLRAREFFTALEERVAFEDRRNGQVKGDPYAAERNLTLTDREYTIAR